jgi:hypothetical protein
MGKSPVSNITVITGPSTLGWEYLSLLEILALPKRDLIFVQHQYNNCTTTSHMRVGPIRVDPSM